MVGNPATKVKMFGKQGLSCLKNFIFDSLNWCLAAVNYV